jgi:hypothetical protein
MSRPLLVSDCDEVLLHMVVPFAQWLDEDHGIIFDMASHDWSTALRNKADNDLVKPELIWSLLRGFFKTEMHRQYPINGAVEAVNSIAQNADVVILTNLFDEERDARREQLRAIGIDFPVYTNQGGKGDALNRILDEYQPSVAVFVDDLAQQHSSIAEVTPHVWRLHMVGEPLIASRFPKAEAAHHRIDDWSSASQWIDTIFKGEAAHAA